MARPAASDRDTSKLICREFEQRNGAYMNETTVLWEETVQPGATCSHALKRGMAAPHAGTVERLDCAPGLLAMAGRRLVALRLEREP